MNLHIKQRTLERLRMYSLNTTWNGTYATSEPGSPAWRALQGAVDRPAPVTIGQMVAAHDAVIAQENWQQRRQEHQQHQDRVYAQLEALIANERRERPEFPPNTLEPEFETFGFDHFLVGAKYAAILILMLFVSYALTYTATLTWRYFSHEHQTSGHLPAAQTEKGELAK